MNIRPEVSWARGEAEKEDCPGRDNGVRTKKLYEAYLNPSTESGEDCHRRPGWREDQSLSHVLKVGIYHPGALDGCIKIKAELE